MRIATETSPSGGGARAKRKAAQKRKDPMDDIVCAKSTKRVAEPVVASINLSNNLHLPGERKHRLNRSWYLYDIIEPAPRFRRMGQDYGKGGNRPTYVSEGEDSDDLSDSPGEGKLPVLWSGYM
jgi:hypothetical protein